MTASLFLYSWKKVLLQHYVAAVCKMYLYREFSLFFMLVSCHKDFMSLSYLMTMSVKSLGFQHYYIEYCLEKLNDWL